MKALRERIKCAGCNQEVEQIKDIAIELKDVCLDGYTDGNEKYFRINECPFCHLVGYDLSKASPDQQNALGDPIYKEIIKEDNQIYRKLKLLEYLAGVDYDIYLQAQAQLLLYWYCNEQGWNSNQYLQRAIGLYKQITESNYCDAQDMITLIDLLRQDGDFEEAKKYLKDLIETIEGYTDYGDAAAFAHYLKQAEQEREYLDAMDVASHYKRN